VDKFISKKKKKIGGPKANATREKELRKRTLILPSTKKKRMMGMGKKRFPYVLVI